MEKEEALILLKPHLSAFSEIMRSGFNRYFENNVTSCAIHSKRSRASVIHDEQVTVFREIGIGKAIQEHGREVFLIADAVIIQCKKLDNRLLVQNYPTLFAFQFNSNEQLSLKGIASALPRLNLGYVPNQTWTEVNGVFLTFQNKHGLSWSHALDSHIDQTEIPEIIKPENLSPSIRVRKPKIGGENEFSGESKAL